MAGTNGLEQLRRKLAAVADGELKRAMLLSLAEEARKLILMGFRNATSPYGEPWAPLKEREGQPLQDTGRLKNSLLPKATPTGIRIDGGAGYGAFHQYGTKHIPQRAFLPEQSRGLGAPWTSAFTRTMASVMRAQMVEGRHG